MKPSNMGGAKKGSRIPRTRRNVGSRTGVAVLAGKTVRKDARGMENFDDYFTEEEESVLSDLDEPRDKPNASKENAIVKQSKSPRNSSGKPGPRLSGKNVQKTSQRAVMERESSDEEYLVPAGSKNGSLTASRIEEISSLLHAKQRLSFDPSPKLSSSTKQASKINHKRTSPKKPTTTQLNDQEFDSSDEDLFVPVRLDWTVLSKRLSSPVHSTSKAASSPASKSVEASPRPIPRKQTPLKAIDEAMPNRRTSLARQSLPSARDKNHVPKHSKHDLLEEDSDEEPIPTPRKSPMSVNRKRSHRANLHGSSSESEDVPRQTRQGKHDADRHNQWQEESEDGGIRLVGMKPEVLVDAGLSNRFVRNLNAEDWKTPEKSGKATTPPSMRSKPLQHDRPSALVVPPTGPKSRVPMRTGAKSSHVPSCREEPEQRDSESATDVDAQTETKRYNLRELSEKPVAILVSSRKRYKHPKSSSSRAETDDEQNSDADAEVAASPPKTARQKAATSAQVTPQRPSLSRDAANSSAAGAKRRGGRAVSPGRNAKTAHRDSSPTATSAGDSSDDKTGKKRSSLINGRSPWSFDFPEDHTAPKRTKPAKKGSQDLSSKTTKKSSRGNGETKIPKKKATTASRNADAGRKGLKKDVNESAQEGGDLRRSKRNRVPVLARHIGQRIIYKTDASGLLVVDGIEEGSKHASKMIFKRKAKRKQLGNARAKREVAGVVQVEDSFLVNEEMDDVPQDDILVINPETNEEVYVDCIRVKKSFVYVGATGEKVGRDDPIILTKPLEQKAFSSGIILIRPHQEKGNHYVQHDAMVFWVIIGRVEVTVHKTTVVLDEMDTFFVPPGNKYNIKNLTNSSVKLLFFQHKREKSPGRRSQLH